MDLDPSEKLLAELSKDTNLITACSNLDLTVNGYTVPDRLFATSFDELKLSEELRKALYSLHIEKPSAVQASCFFTIQSEDNVVFQAPAGTGKTLGFVVSTLQKIKNYEIFHIAVMVPTKELSQQISDVYALFLAELGGTCLNMCASENNSSERILSRLSEDKSITSTNDTQTTDDVSDISQKSPCVVVGTPAAIMKAHSQRTIDLNKASMIVIDEADHIVSNFFTQTYRIFKHCVNSQKIFFSASFSEQSKDAISKLITGGGRSTNFALGVPKTTEEIMFFNIHCQRKDKIMVLKDLLTLLTASQIIIFCKQKNTVDLIEQQLQADDFPVTKIHGGMQLVDRENAVIAFKKIEYKILVSTDLFGRGMDIPLVNLVINFDLPVDYETQTPNFECYQHRVGRTARFGRKGFVIDFLSSEKDFDDCARICKNFGISQETIDIDSLEKAFLKIPC